MKSILLAEDKIDLKLTEYFPENRRNKRNNRRPLPIKNDHLHQVRIGPKTSGSVSASISGSFHKSIIVALEEVLARRKLI